MLNGTELKGKQVCLRCKELYLPDNQICQCGKFGQTPILAPASLVHTYSIEAIRRLPEYRDNFTQVSEVEES